MLSVIKCYHAIDRLNSDEEKNMGRRISGGLKNGRQDIRYIRLQ